MTSRKIACPVCDFAFQPGDNIRECESCGMSVHDYCSEAGSDNLYRCAFCIEADEAADEEEQERLNDRSKI